MYTFIPNEQASDKEKLPEMTWGRKLKKSEPPKGTHFYLGDIESGTYKNCFYNCVFYGQNITELHISVEYSTMTHMIINHSIHLWIITTHPAFTNCIIYLSWQLPYVSYL